MAIEFPSDKIILDSKEDNAMFLGINHVDILQIKGLEFYHMFIIVLLRDPGNLRKEFRNRASLFYNVNSRNNLEHEVTYYNISKWKNGSVWETTISASSECAYDVQAKKLGNLTKVPNFDRVSNNKSGKRVFVKKISSNNIEVIEKALEFEMRYDNSLKYTLIPETSKNGYNSNSFFRGILDYSGLIDSLEVPNCFKSPGLSKTIDLNN